MGEKNAIKLKGDHIHMFLLFGVLFQIRGCNF
jgi:hypothetical protein